MEPQKRRWLRVSEFAAALSIHPRTVRRMIARRQIPFVKRPGVGVRVDWEAYAAELERYKVPAREPGRGQV